MDIHIGSSQPNKAKAAMSSPLRNKLGRKTGPQKYPEAPATCRAKSTFGKINPHFLVNERYKHLGFLCFIK